MNAPSNYALNVATKGGWGRLSEEERNDLKDFLSCVPEGASASLEAILKWLSDPSTRDTRGHRALVKLLVSSQDEPALGHPAEGGNNAD